jgi:hypothetical protein
MTDPQDYIEDAGAKTESDSERNGFLSYHAESHAAGVGLGIAWLAMVTGNLQLLGLVVPAITAGLRAKNREFSKILTDIKQEPHYTLGGLVVGATLGVGVRMVLLV